MIEITRKSSCCGCGACAQACPKNCIVMKEDEEGFLYTVVDAAKCVDCGLCEKVCPIRSKKDSGGPETVKAYAAYVKNEDIRRESSSGGIFSVIAQWVLDQGGAVFGAAFAEDFSVHHVMIESVEELSRLRGSKYVQSSIGDTFRMAKEQLEAGRTVLFSGVGCQIAGLKAYLQKDYEKLYTVDVLCHGTPSPMVWQKYRTEQEAKRKTKTASVCFRNKDTGWNGYSVAMDFENGDSYSRDHGMDPYMQLFLSDICLRPSCHSCAFKDIPRQSDITLGDAWGIRNVMPEMDDDRGTSVVLLHTQKGRDLWSCLQEQLVAKEGKLDALLPPSADSRRSVAAHPNRKKFFKAVRKGASPEELTRLTKKSPIHKLFSLARRCLRKAQRILKK